MRLADRRARGKADQDMWQADIDSAGQIDRKTDRKADLKTDLRTDRATTGLTPYGMSF